MEYNYWDSKEEIKDRMIKTALDFWNIKKVENLDPFVRLLIEALAMQLHLVADDIADIEVRTVKRLSEVLLPEYYAVARPAYALIHLSPLVENVCIDVLSGFTLADPFPGRKEKLKFSFYPVCQSYLRKATVYSLIVDGDFYSVLPDLSKKLIARGDSRIDCFNKVFVGIDFEGDRFDLQNLSLYVDFPNVDQRKLYLSQLSYCKCAVDGEDLSFERGVFQKKNTKEDCMFSKSISEDVNSSVMEVYNLNFMTFNEVRIINASAKRAFPKGIPDIQHVSKKPLLWMEIIFPTSFPLSILKDIQVLLNVVPVANKELHHETSLVRKSFGVLPLPLSERESFLGMERVEDEFGKVYRRNGWQEGEFASGYYSLRQGGCESFDKRDAKDFLLRLQHLLEDEMAVFASSEIGRHTENRYLIESLLAKISRVSKQVDVGSEPLHYLFVDPSQDATLFYAHYWTTYGVWANGIRAGLKLNPQEQMYGEVGQAQLVVSTTGGAAIPSEQERIARFKYLLGSRDRIVTNADIENYCYSEFSDCLLDIHVEKGIKVSEVPQEGLIRTIDVHLVLNKDVDSSRSLSIADRVYNGLVARSPMTFNYRVLVD
ncbi:MAG: hypothetical protein MJZ33_03675 [Paludibacteraceae bacterium]|nr:hypothetical protein [Paludibacteraceae bacterium]